MRVTGQVLEAARRGPRIGLGRAVKQTWRFSPDDLAAQERVSGQISSMLLSSMASRGLSNSDATVKKVASAMEDAADRELVHLFSTMASVIEQSSETQPQLTTSSLASGMVFAQGFRKSVPMNTIAWAPLTRRWSQRKFAKNMPGAGKMFKATGTLERYLGTNSEALAIKKLGLSEVTIQTPETQADIRRVKKLGLARIELRMMPKVSALLLPLLRSGKWTDNEGARRLDKNLFAGTSAGRKLAGASHTYRPFLVPTLQFFMIYRIPVAMRAAINNLVRK